MHGRVILQYCDMYLQDTQVIVHGSLHIYITRFQYLFLLSDARCIPGGSVLKLHCTTSHLTYASLTETIDTNV